MFDTMTMTKVVGGFCGAFLIFLFAKWGGEILYHTGGGHGHGDDHAQAYVIDTGDSGHDGDAVAEVEVPFEEVFAAADAGAGEKLFRGCKSCHSLEDGKNGTGPSLYGIVNRAVGAADGFGYSGALVAVAETWTPEALNGFIEDPKEFAPGTKMSYKGLDDIEDRANLIAYLGSVGG